MPNIITALKLSNREAREVMRLTGMDDLQDAAMRLISLVERGQVLLRPQLPQMDKVGDHYEPKPAHARRIAKAAKSGYSKRYETAAEMHAAIFEKAGIAPPAHLVKTRG